MRVASCVLIPAEDGDGGGGKRRGMHSRSLARGDADSPLSQRRVSRVRPGRLNSPSSWLSAGAFSPPSSAPGIGTTCTRGASLPLRLSFSP